MATFREMIYIVLDLLKERSDDAYYTEEHVLFLLSRVRALLLNRKYRGSRNTAFAEPSTENMQQICVSLSPESLLPFSCEGKVLRSTTVIPDVLAEQFPRITPVSDVLHSNVTFVPIERMPYVGRNKWLKNIIYAAKSSDGYLYLQSNNPAFIYLESVKLDAVFANPEAAAKLSCNSDDSSCDILDQRFPLEESLVPVCIETVLQEILGSRYAPEDKQNNARDDFGDISVSPGRGTNAARKQTRTQDAQQED